METWQIVVGLAVIAALIVGYVIGRLRDGWRSHTSTTSAWVGVYGQSIWIWRAGAWTNVLDLSKAGCVAGPAPAAPGQFEDQCVRVVSVRRS